MNAQESAFPYGDMLALPHHTSPRHPPLPLERRAAQFAPFAALTGYEAVIAETARTTEPRQELSEAARECLDGRLHQLHAHLAERPPVQLLHFVPDAKKAGGAYQWSTGRLAAISPDSRTLHLADGRAIAAADVAAIESPVIQE